MPKLSIVIPVFNAKRHLRACLVSILSQSLRDLEVVCVDNGSTDGSLDILEEYGRDGRVRAIREVARRGAGAARNAGLARATGEWVHFVDADDIVLPFAEETAVRFAEGRGADVVVFGAEEYDDATGWTTPLPLDLSVRPGDRRFLRAYSTSPWNKLFRRDFLAKEGIRFQDIPRSNDIAFTVEALCRSKNTAVLGKTLYRYRIHGGGSLQDTKSETPDAWRDALAEAKRRLSAAGILDRHGKAFGLLEKDVRLSNARSLPARIAASVRRRGPVRFLKHALGAIKKKLSCLRALPKRRNMV